MNATAIRKRLYALLDPLHGGALNSAIIIVILISSLAVILETIPGLEHHRESAFYYLEAICLVIFTLEYVARLWVAVDNPLLRRQLGDDPVRIRLHYALSPIAIVDLITILPPILAITVDENFLALWLLRLLRLLKLTRSLPFLTLLGDVLKAEARSFAAALFLLIILSLFSAAAMYTVERHAQPEVFTSIPAAMWWALVTLATVGYGDVTPVTTMGQIVAGITIIIGVGFVALPAGMLASRFSEELTKRRADFRHAAEKRPYALMSAEEKEALEELRIELCLSRDDANRILKEIERSHTRLPLGTPRTTHCPHCGETLE